MQDDQTVGRRGRPPGTSARKLEVIALRLFAEHGYEATTVEQIAAAAGVSGRTFFRYFESKTSVLWSEFDHEVASLRDELATMPAELSIMDAVRRAVLAVNHYRADHVPELRTRMSLVSSAPDLVASASLHYDAWERAISEFAANRTGQPADSLFPLALGRVSLAACRSAYERWAERADADLVHYLDAALRAVAAGFTDTMFVPEPVPTDHAPVPEHRRQAEPVGLQIGNARPSHAASHQCSDSGGTRVGHGCLGYWTTLQSP